jgi:hypothetical protein
MVLAGCGGSSGTPAPTLPPTATPVVAPTQGACYVLTFDQAVAPTAASRPDAVDCASSHTSETFFVGTLSTDVDGHLLAVDSARVQRQSARACPARLPEYVGGSADDLRLSMLRAVWFTPSVEESDAGADWLRCDVVLVGGAEKLSAWSGLLKGRLEKDDPAIAMCGTAAPGSAGFERVPCSDKHTWKAIEVVDLPGDDYPGETVVKDAGQDQCKQAGQDASDDALDYKWSYEWPTEDQWNAGQNYGRCWVPTA